MTNIMELDNYRNHYLCWLIGIWAHKDISKFSGQLLVDGLCCMLLCLTKMKGSNKNEGGANRPLQHS